MDFKGLITNPFVLAALAGGAGYYFGPKYHKEKGQLYGAIAGAGLGYLLGRYLAPKAAPAPAQLTAQAQQTIDQQVGEILGDYVDIDAYEDVREAPPQRPQAPQRPQQRPVPQQAQQAPQAPPPGVDDLSDLSEGWGESLGSFAGALGGGTSDRELDEIIAGAEAANGKRGN